jgi:glycine betaine/choline ABC-type transport system substrate-binding protein
MLPSAASSFWGAYLCRCLVVCGDRSRAAGGLRAGFTSEFVERPDGYPGLSKAYEFRFRDVRDLDPAIMYEAVAKSKVDVICAFLTDGRIAAYNLKALADDRGFFPPYHAAPVVRLETLKRRPELRGVLARLAGVLDNATMRRLNYEVDEKKRATVDVAKKFLESRGLTK